MKQIMLLFALTLSACGATYRDTARPMASVTEFDVNAYLGTWYEVARYPVSFQRSCTATTATYGPLDENTITVENACREDTPDGPLRKISGTAAVAGPGQLRVKFDTVPFIRAPYWVLWVDDTYTTAVVGVPNGRAGWILARTPQISSAKQARSLEVLKANGYDTSALINVAH